MATELCRALIGITLQLSTWKDIMDVDQRVQAKKDDKVIPGSYLGPLSAFTSGEGTQVRREHVYATLTGKVDITSADTAGESQQDRPVITVVPRHPRVVVPRKGAIVLCRVISISHRQAKVAILSVNETALREEVHGVVRREDIRETEKDTVEVFPSFRPRDVLRARVIGLGESYGYVLSTAENELGVVFATSEQGGKMVPVSWCEMQCTVTRVRERRKVAKVVNAVPIS